MEKNIKLKKKKNIILTFQKLLAKPLYYSDPSDPRTENIDKDDITILLKINDLSPKVPNIANIVISFNQDNYMHITK